MGDDDDDFPKNIFVFVKNFEEYTFFHQQRDRDSIFAMLSMLDNHHGTTIIGGILLEVYTKFY